MDIIQLKVFAWAALGAFVLEALHWYQLNHRMLPAEFAAAAKSPRYWIVASLFVVLPGVLAIAWFGGRPSISTWDVVAFGLGFPAVVKKAAKGTSESTGTERSLGQSRGRYRVSLDRYFDS